MNNKFGSLPALGALFLALSPASGAVIVVDGGWQTYTYSISTYGDAGSMAPDNPFTFTTSTITSFRITDFGGHGEYYSVFEGTDDTGALLLATPVVAFGPGTGSNDPDVTYADPSWSSGELILNPGTYTFAIRQEPLLPGYGVWNVAVRVDSIPEPQRAVLMGLALLGIALRRRRG